MVECRKAFSGFKIPKKDIVPISTMSSCPLMRHEASTAILNVLWCSSECTLVRDSQKTTEADQRLLHERLDQRHAQNSKLRDDLAEAQQKNIDALQDIL